MRNVYERVFVPSTGDHHAGQGESGVSGDCRAISGGIDASVPELTRLSGGQRLGNTGVVRHRSYPCPQRGERGAITAEFAMVLPVAMVLMILLLSLTRVVTTSMACQDAASAAVRELVITRTPAGSAEAQRIASTAAIAVAGKAPLPPSRRMGDWSLYAHSARLFRERQTSCLPWSTVRRVEQAHERRNAYRGTRVGNRAHAQRRGHRLPRTAHRSGCRACVDCVQTSARHGGYGGGVSGQRIALRNR